MQVNRRNNHQKEYLSFFCPKHKNKQGCSAKEIDLVKLENFVLSKLGDYIFTDENINTFLSEFSMIKTKKSDSEKKEIKESKAIHKSNERKIQNCISQIESGCTKTVADRLGKRVEELEKENNRVEKKLNKLLREFGSVPTFDEVVSLKNKFTEYMQSKSNLPIRKEFLLQTVEKITVYDDTVEVIFNI